MINVKRKFNTVVLCGAMLLSSAVVAAGGGVYEVTITNLTRSQAFTPVLVSSHRKGVELFTPGQAASPELAALAEGGDTAPLTATLEANSAVVDISQSDGLINPGQSATVMVSAAEDARFISLASMLIPTNDAFLSLNAIRAPLGNGTAVHYSPAYDAGSELNDELCMNIPGPVCGGEGGSPGAGGEDYVHVHGGIHGVGDLDAASYDWRNPVAKIAIRKMK